MMFTGALISIACLVTIAIIGVIAATPYVQIAAAAAFLVFGGMWVHDLPFRLK